MQYVVTKPKSVHTTHISLVIIEKCAMTVVNRIDSKLAPSQWETLLQSNAVSRWLGANLGSAFCKCTIDVVVYNTSFHRSYCCLDHGAWRVDKVTIYNQMDSKVHCFFLYAFNSLRPSDAYKRQ